MDSSGSPAPPPPKKGLHVESTWSPVESMWSRGVHVESRETLWGRVKYTYDECTCDNKMKMNNESGDTQVTVNETK